jgi:hypothetical protein
VCVRRLRACSLRLAGACASARPAACRLRCLLNRHGRCAQRTGHVLAVALVVRAAKGFDPDALRAGHALLRSRRQREGCMPAALRARRRAPAARPPAAPRRRYPLPPRRCAGRRAAQAHVAHVSRRLRLRLAPNPRCRRRPPAPPSPPRRTRRPPSQRPARRAATTHRRGAAVAGGFTGDAPCALHRRQAARRSTARAGPWRRRPGRWQWQLALARIQAVPPAAAAGPFAAAARAVAPHRRGGAQTPCLVVRASLPTPRARCVAQADAMR